MPAGNKWHMQITLTEKAGRRKKAPVGDRNRLTDWLTGGGGEKRRKRRRSRCVVLTAAAVVGGGCW